MIFRPGNPCLRPRADYALRSTEKEGFPSPIPPPFPTVRPPPPNAGRVLLDTGPFLLPLSPAIFYFPSPPHPLSPFRFRQETGKFSTFKLKFSPWR